MTLSTTSARVACGLAVLAAGVVYLNALDNPFIYDDYPVIVENRSLDAPLSLTGLVLHNVSRPVINVSYAIDRLLWGSSPIGFHVTNVVLHMLNVGLLFLLVATVSHERRTSGAVSVSGLQTEPVQTDVMAATLAALCLAVHPVMTQAVGYISGRSEVLCVTWLLLALLSAGRWIRTEQTRWLAATGGLWLMALATKETAAMFPFLVFLYDRLLCEGTATERRRRLLRLHAPLFGVATVAVAIRLFVLAVVEDLPPLSPDWQFALVEVDVVRRYVGLLLTPTAQSIFHAVAPVSGPFDPRVLMGAGLLAAMLGLVWRLRSVEGRISFGLLWFGLLLVPSSVLVVLDRAEPMAEHRLYSASVGAFFAAGVAAQWLLNRLRAIRPATMRTVQVAIAVWLVVLGGRTVLRNALWDDPLAVWTEATIRSPDHWLPELLLAEELQRRGRCEEAVIRFRRSIELYPEEPTGYRKLGACLIELGWLEEARSAFQQLQRQAPASVHATNGLGALALAGGDSGLARQYFAETLANDPDNAQAREGLELLER